MKVRTARPEDLPELLRLRREMSYPGSLFLGESAYLERALERLQHALPRLSELPDVRVLVLLEDDRPSGYFFLTVDDHHGVTQQLQGVLLDFAVFRFDGLAKLVTRARKMVRAFENEYLVVDLAAQDQRTQVWFYRCGFRGEQTRVVKFVERGWRGRSSPQYPIRPARPDDLPFLLEVHAAFTRAYRPAGREVDLEALEAAFQMNYLLLDLNSPLYFVMEEASTGRRVGYLLLQAGEPVDGHKTFYVYDVAIAPEYSGRGLSVFLQARAEQVAGLEGGFVYGDGTLEMTSLSSWHAQMGYPVDTIRFALDCRG